MPTAVPVGSIVNYTIQGELANQLVMNEFHYVTSGSSAPDIDIFMSAVNTTLVGVGKLFDTWTAYVNNALVNIKTRVQVIYPVRYAYKEFVNTTTTGAGLGLPAPPNVSCVFTRRGVDAGRGNVGTTHLPGINLNDISNGRVTAGAQTNIGTIAAQAIATVASGIAGVNLIPILYKRSAPGSSVPPKTYIVQTTTRIERRRTVGLGA